MKTLFALFVSAAALCAQSSGVGSIWTVVSGTLQSAAVANGNGSTLAVQGLSTALVTVNCSSACSGGTTITFQISQDGTNFSSVSAQQSGTTTIASTVLNQGTTPTVWVINVAGAQLLRAPISGYSAGTVTVTASAIAGSPGPNAVSVPNTVNVAGTGTAGTPGTAVLAVQGVASGTNVPISGAVSQTSGPWTQNLTQVDGSALGAPSAYGTSPGAVTVPGVNAFVTNTPAVSQSGNWLARIEGNAGGIMDAAGQNASSPANELLTGCQFNTSPTTITSTNMSPVQCDNAGNTLVDLKTALPAGTNAIGTVQPGNTQNTTPWLENPIPSTSSTYAFGALPYFTNATSTSTYTTIKSSVGNVYGWDVVNPNASTCWLQFYNSTTPTVGTSIAFAVPFLPSGGAARTLPFPANLSTAISIATTTTATGSTECSTGMGLTLYYQ